MRRAHEGLVAAIVRGGELARRDRRALAWWQRTPARRRALVVEGAGLLEVRDGVVVPVLGGRS